MRKKKFSDGQVFTIESLSPHKERTPEGYLLCRDVPISRVGEFEYTAIESGIRGKNGKVILARSPEELFSDDTMASFEGKPVVIGHDRFADPTNWKEISVGIVRNVRQGDGEEKGLLLADLLLTDEKGISMVERGELREVSCGYDSQTIDDGDGRGHQVGIVGNHVALVSRARCGSVCSVRDGFMAKETFKQKLRRLFRDGDEDKFNATLDEMNEPKADEDPAPTTEQKPDDVFKALVEKIESIEQRLGKIESAHTVDEEEEKNKAIVDEEEAKEVADEEAAQVIADAEEIAPGMQKPACDSAGGKYTRGLIRRVQRQALKIAGVKKFGDTASMTGQALDIAFKAAVDAHRAGRNPMPRMTDSAPKEVPVSLNERFAKFWNQ